MNKHNLANILRKQYGFSWRDSRSIIESILSSIKKELRSGNRVNLQGFGTFTIKQYGPRKYKDIKTGKVRISSSKNKIKFKPSRNFLQS